MNSDYFKEMRIKKGYSQKSLAKEVNVTTGIVCHWEKGVRIPRLHVLIDLCRILDMDANKLLNLN